MVRSLRHGLRVVEVRREGPGVVSVICSGRHLDRLAVSGGQFFCWRFLAPGMWWQAHPFSLSALPRPPYLRLTAKAVGDYSASLARLRRGTRVMVEGPYGAFTRHAQRRPRALLIAAGIGVTALRALLEDLPGGLPAGRHPAGQPPAKIWCSAARSATWSSASTAGCTSSLGPREQVSMTGQALRRLVPDLHQRDVYVCGPEGFVASVVDLVRYLRVPDEAIHHEAFAL